jgi:membrane-associated protein
METAIAWIGQVFQPNEFLAAAIDQMGAGVYFVLFAIVFAETGLVFTPFLPGDSLLFAAGALAGLGAMDFWLLAAILLAAAVLGDAVNYFVGRTLGRRILAAGTGRFIKAENVRKTEEFFDRHGGTAIVLARFVPIVRTFAPFVAGMSRMPLAKFWAYNITGAIAWVALFTGAGFLFGNLPWVEENLTLAMIVIVLISVLPMGLEAMRHRRRSAVAAVVEPEPEPGPAE